MQKFDVPQVQQRLTELAGALGGKAPTPSAMQVWLDALAECHVDDVKAALADWSKEHTRMPAPADILRAARTRLSDRVEEESRRNNASALRPEDLRPRTHPAEDPQAWAAYQQFCRKFRTLLANRPAPKAWAYALRAKEEAGEPLLLIQREKWRMALGFAPNAKLAEINAPPLPQMPEIDEAAAELIAERRAIQAEGMA